MVEKVRFIHAADIHLGSYLHYSGKAPAKIRDSLKSATFTAFSRICELALDNQVDFMILSGDLFDREARSVMAGHFFNQECEKLKKAGINIYLIAGNHDPLREQGELLEFPDNVYCFGSEPEIMEAYGKGGTSVGRIIGASYQGRSDSRKLVRRFSVPDRSMFNIGMLHTQLEPGNKNYLPCSFNELNNCTGLDYWALGHIHHARVLQDKGPVIAYPGIPQGRDFGELNAGGCLLVELSSDRDPVIKFLPVSPVIWGRFKIVIDEDREHIPANLNDLQELVSHKAEMILENPYFYAFALSNKKEDIAHYLDDKLSREYPVEGFIIQWVIKGRGEIDRLIREQEEEAEQVLVSQLQLIFQERTPFLWTDSVVFQTGRPIPDLIKLETKNPVLREINKIIELIEEEGKLNKRICNELGQIWERNIDPEQLDETKFHLDTATLKEILERAKQLIYEELIEGGIKK